MIDNPNNPPKKSFKETILVKGAYKRICESLYFEKYYFLQRKYSKSYRINAVNHSYHYADGQHILKTDFMITKL